MLPFEGAQWRFEQPVSFVQFHLPFDMLGMVCGSMFGRELTHDALRMPADVRDARLHRAMDSIRHTASLVEPTNLLLDSWALILAETLLRAPVQPRRAPRACIVRQDSRPRHRARHRLHRVRHRSGSAIDVARRRRGDERVSLCAKFQRNRRHIAPCGARMWLLKPGPFHDGLSPQSRRDPRRVLPARTLTEAAIVTAQLPHPPPQNAPSGRRMPSQRPAAPWRGRHSRGRRDSSPARRTGRRGAARPPSGCRRRRRCRPAIRVPPAPAPGA